MDWLVGSRYTHLINYRYSKSRLDKGFSLAFVAISDEIGISRMVELMLPAQLPAVSTLELLVFKESHSLGFLAPKSLSQLSGKVLEGQVVQDIADLFRQLPPGEPARCHIPPFGLRFHSPDGLQRECSICWMCNNIYGDFQYNFDGAAPVSKRLFSLLDRLAK